MLQIKLQIFVLVDQEALNMRLMKIALCIMALSIFSSFLTIPLNIAYISGGFFIGGMLIAWGAGLYIIVKYLINLFWKNKKDT